MNILKILYLCMIFSFLSLNANTNVKIIPPQSKYDSSHDYFYNLLKEVFKNSGNKYEKVDIIFSSKMEQGRAFIELNKAKNLDVYWAGTSMNREKEFTAIKIPLLKGLLGYRKFIINKKKIRLFDEIKTLEDLKKLKACQGTHWPDTKILEYAGLEVIKNTNYELMFLQVQKNRCDYFPRGIHEIVSEINVRKNKYADLILYEDMILYYPFPMYFFVSKNNTKLAQRIENGLLKMIYDGSFDKYIKTHEITKHLFPIKNWINTKKINLNNPLLSEDTNISNKIFWIIRN